MAEALNQRKDQKQWDSAAMFSMALAVALFIMTMETEENIKMELAMYDQKRSSTSELDGWEYRNNLHNEFVMASVTQHQGKKLQLNLRRFPFAHEVFPRISPFNVLDRHFLFL